MAGYHPEPVTPSAADGASLAKTLFFQLPEERKNFRLELGWNLWQFSPQTTSLTTNDLYGLFYDGSGEGGIRTRLPWLRRRLLRLCEKIVDEGLKTLSSFFGQLDRHVLDDLAEAQVGGGHRELVLRGQEGVEDV